MKDFCSLAVWVLITSHALISLWWSNYQMVLVWPYCLSLSWQFLEMNLQKLLGDGMLHIQNSDGMLHSGCMITVLIDKFTFACLCTVNMLYFLAISSIAKMWLILMFQPPFFNSCCSVNKIMNILISQRYNFLTFVQKSYFNLVTD